MLILIKCLVSIIRKEMDNVWVVILAGGRKRGPRGLMIVFVELSFREVFWRRW